MVVIRNYRYEGAPDLKDLMIKKIGPSKNNMIYLGILSRNNRTGHVYHIHRTTGIFTASEVSLVAVSENEAEKAKNNLEKLLGIELMD